MRCSLFLIPALLVSVLTSTLRATIIHVPGDQPTIQAGIHACVDGDTVLVADGFYRGTGNRDIDFHGKAIAVMSENGLGSCIIDCEGSEAEPHRGFYFHSGEDSTSLLIGFTIMNGYTAFSGGGIYCNSSSPQVSNCTFIGNEAWTYEEDRIPMVTRCTLSNNFTRDAGNGGGMANEEDSHPTVTNCTFSQNGAFGNGGGMWNSESSPRVTNCTFSRNSVLFNGGGMSNWSSSPTVVNCTFSGNWALNSGGMANNNNSDPTVTNSILWGDSDGEIDYSPNSNPIVIYSDVQNGYPGEGNIDADPLFFTFIGFDYFLGPGSPCIDTGTPFTSVKEPTQDGISDWHPRWPDWIPNSPLPDMGAYGGPGNAGWLQ